MPVTILMCADPLNPRRVDEHFAREAEAVRALGGSVALIDHDALQQGDAAMAVHRVPRDLGTVWYRGWMMTSVQYTALASVLGARGVTMAVPPDGYQKAHELPGWYDTFAGVTPTSVWLPTRPGTPPGKDRLAQLVRPLSKGPAIVKDYVKSRKHEWDEACFVPDVTDVDRLHAVVSRLVELQGDSLAGGIVVREFETYEGGEARVWWVDGEPVLAGPHPDTPEVRPRPLTETIAPCVRSLGCRFITTDLARRADGTWRVVETGDGQVSDLPAGAEPADLYLSFPIR
ncbi:ATP-grasp domain-containing protein [Actinoallomurus iriomotensis]|uniref:ATP-grasp domain-containing protein n=1 Tax=Actinoallomurus iriomotensis TaxID=478107 RepID=UPI002555E5BE|nr:ATP-grasp domain-containing protein [Actinoallomurus iriomotensis]